jgi:hypothetical protein
MKNKLDGTPVVPVFIAEKGDADKFVGVDFGMAFPNEPHNRSEQGQKLIEKLKYDIVTNFKFL